MVLGHLRLAPCHCIMGTASVSVTDIDDAQVWKGYDLSVHISKAQPVRIQT